MTPEDVHSLISEPIKMLEKKNKGYRYEVLLIG